MKGWGRWEGVCRKPEGEEGVWETEGVGVGCGRERGEGGAKGVGEMGRTVMPSRSDCLLGVASNQRFKHSFVLSCLKIRFMI